MNKELTYAEMLEVIHELYNTLDGYRRFQHPELMIKVEKVIRKSGLKVNADKCKRVGVSEST